MKYVLFVVIMLVVLTGLCATLGLSQAQDIPPFLQTEMARQQTENAICIYTGNEAGNPDEWCGNRIAITATPLPPTPTPENLIPPLMDDNPVATPVFYSSPTPGAGSILPSVGTAQPTGATRQSSFAQILLEILDFFRH